jgi:ABC-type transport system involved in multi-copper enzyme maturation permease subunit
MIFRRKLFWILYLLALVNFLAFFFGIYLLSQIENSGLEEDGRMRLMGVRLNVKWLVTLLAEHLNLAGTAETYRNFFWLQGYIVMAILAFAGSVLIGNDYQHGSLTFYLAKPLHRWHYLCGKLLAVSLVVNMMTTLPALGLYLEYGLLNDWSYFQEHRPLLWGILGYGAVLTVCLGLLVVSVASWLRKTVPMVLVWVGLLFFGRVLSRTLVDFFRFDHRWRLIDLWNNTYILGSQCLGTEAKLAGRRPPPQPTWEEAGLVVGTLCVLCLIYLNQRIRAVEIVR